MKKRKWRFRLPTRAKRLAPTVQFQMYWWEERNLRYLTVTCNKKVHRAHRERITSGRTLVIKITTALKIPLQNNSKKLD